MKQTVTINTPRDLRAFKREFAHLVDVVKQADGKYVLYVDTHRSPATRTAFITKAAFDAALSPAMRTGSPSAFSDRIAGGRFLPGRLDSAYAAYRSEHAKVHLEATQTSSALIRNRQQYLAVYCDSLGFYPNTPVGMLLNASTNLTRK